MLSHRRVADFLRPDRQPISSDSGSLHYRELPDWKRVVGRTARRQQAFCDSDVRDRRQSRLSFHIQISRLFYRYDRSPAIGRHRAMAYRAAARHFVLHLHADRIPGRCLSTQGQRNQIRELRAVCLLFSASGRGADFASCRDDASVCRRPISSQAGKFRDRPVGVLHRAFQEGHGGRPPRAAGAPDLRCGRAGRRFVGSGGMVGSAMLCAADLFRLLRLFRHGDRAVAPVRGEIAAEFQFALQGRQHHRILAALGT